MVIRCCYILLFAQLKSTYTASIGEKTSIEGVFGSSAVFEIPSSENEHQCVIWRFNNSLNVCDLIEGKCSVEHQHPQFKKRTETQFVNGNSLLKLNNLTYSDSGDYYWYIPDSGKCRIVQLSVIANTTTAAATSRAAPTTLAAPSAPEDGNHTGFPTWLIIIIVISFLVLCGIFIWVKKKKPFCLGLSAPGGYLRALLRRSSNTPEAVIEDLTDISGVQIEPHST
ncbi:uncharacterized protein LOC130430680 [Triplophysa dalaica]|uniref:uncharacterized protein LOC130430680 n=1 Tax=Triplophysa dalaica TaxID=1582913 RepID=UPI0024E03CF6|nr:uncharacterized protein LOC130430680 [Triplophysa dalaica]